MDIVTAINELKAEKDQHKTRIVEIDAQLAEIAGTLPRRRAAKATEAKPVKARKPRAEKSAGEAVAS